MPIEAELHDGRILEFPDGTDPAIIQKTVKEQLGVSSQLATPDDTIQPISSFNDPRGAVLTLGSEALAVPASGIAGIVGTIGGLVPGGESPSEKGNRFLETTRDALTVDPVNQASERTVDAIGKAAESLGETLTAPVAALGTLAQTEEFRAAQDPELDRDREARLRETTEQGIGPTLGEKTFEATGSPGLATVAETAPAAVAAALGTRFSSRPLAARQKIARNAQQRFGLRTDPIAAETGGVAAIAEGVGGQAGVQRTLAAQNQSNIRRAVASELGLPEGSPVTRKTLGNLRREAGGSSRDLKRHGNLETDTAYRRDVANAVKELKDLQKESPSLSKGDSKILKAAKELNKENLKYSVAVVQLKRIRELARQAFKKSPERGRAFSALAKSLEDIMDRDLLRRGLPDDVARLRADRQLIAKTHTVEDALKGVDIDAGKFAKALERGEPLSGALEELGAFATEFPDLVKVSKRGNPPASAFDAATFFARPALRSLARLPNVPENAGTGVNLTPASPALLPFLNEDETNNR